MQVLRADDVSDGINMLKLRLTSHITVDLSVASLDACSPPSVSLLSKSANVKISMLRPAKVFSKAICIANLYSRYYLSFFFIISIRNLRKSFAVKGTVETVVRGQEFRRTERYVYTGPPADAP